MKQISFTIFLLLFLNGIFAQKSTVKGNSAKNEYAAMDKLALLLPDSCSKSTSGISGYILSNFKTDTEKARAIYVWLATNIQYDIENMFAINFYEEKDAKIAKPLRTRKGICENYAALFNDICTKSGIKSYVIEGYTKQNGFTDYIPHAWCAALIDTSWYMFDPTWGSGYIANGKFVQQISNEYFKVNPAELIKSHMPFDFMWQFLNYPVTNQEFYEGNTQMNKTKAFFNYADSIKVYESMNQMEQLAASAYRIEKNGVKNSLIFDRLQHIKLQIENDRQTQNVNIYNTAVSDYNDGINLYNDFINYRNKQFTPMKTDAVIQSMIDASGNKLDEARIKLDLLQKPDMQTVSLVAQLKKSIDDVEKLVNEQKDWLKLYFSKGKSGRKNMFYDKKLTWFGIPLN
jgi:hypothetical protein